MPSFVPTNLVCLSLVCCPSTVGQSDHSSQPASTTCSSPANPDLAQALHDPPSHAVFRGRGSQSPPQT